MPGQGPDTVAAGDDIVEREAGADSAPASPRADAASTPRVRTLLVCDLAESTALVERLGDAAAADLLRKHDRLARALMPAHGGREIDKTDGFLVLFERPVQAVAFALAYQRALRQLSDDSGHALRARIGIHMGEVVLWQNAASEIAEGAKPVDVEGLAKPVAARLMALALPGQTLLSGVAFSLAQRAEREVGGEHPVRWLTHGRYRFKGVPAPMLVHEVGEAGLAPLTAPPSGGKAQREVPLWRRPSVLTLEAIAVIAAIAVPVALTLRAPPAIAFGERDWVVVGDLRNLTGEATLDEPLETAFRISLEQSRYVNVLPDLKLRDALARMQRPADVEVDRAVASEIALREGARAVILPTVAEIGGRVRVSAEVIDPTTQTTVYAESADGVGAPSALDSIDDVTQELRGRLGEALAAIEADSEPLPKVTSGNLDALRAYALGVRALVDTKVQDALRLFDQALALDPEFSLAHIGRARVLWVLDDHAGARREVEAAAATKDRLTPRDALYVDAWHANFGPTAAKLEKWRVLGQMYPDYHAAHYNYALFALEEAGRPDAALEAIAPNDVPQNPMRDEAHYMRGSAQAWLGRVPEALESFRLAMELGSTGRNLQYALTEAMAGHHDAATAVLDAALAPDDPSARRDALEARYAIALDRGAFAHAIALEAAALRAGEDPDAQAVASSSSAALQAAALSIADGDSAAARAGLGPAIERYAAWPAEHDAGGSGTRCRRLVASAWLAARAGDAEAAEQALAAAASELQLRGVPLEQAHADVARAEILRARGDYAAALRALHDAERIVRIFPIESTRLRVQREAGETADARETAKRVVAARHLALAGVGANSMARAMNVIDARLAMLDSAELALSDGDEAAARGSLAAFRAAWPDLAPLPGVARRVDAVSARLATTAR